MSQHLHATRVEGCFRCELSRDELEPECDVCDDDRWVNREVDDDGVEWGDPCPDCTPEPAVSDATDMGDNWVWCDDWERPSVFPPANSALHRYWCNPHCVGPHKALLIGPEIDNGYTP